MEIENPTDTAPTQAPPLLLTVREAARLLAIGRSALYRLMQQGTVPSVLIGGSRRIPARNLENYIERSLGTNREDR